MKRNFECLKCHHKFEADDNKDVFCPHCGSDNVRPVGNNTTSILLKVGAFLIAAIIGFSVVKFTKDDNKVDLTEVTDMPSSSGSSHGNSSSELTEIPQEEETAPAPNKDIQAQEKKIEQEAKTVKVNQPITFYVTTPKADADGTYSFTTRAEHLPQGVSVKSYTLSDGSQVVATSTDGRFKGVPASPNKGLYTLSAELSDGRIITRDREVGGFSKVEKVDTRMQPDELTALLNKRDKDLGLGKNKNVIKRPTIVINNSTDENDKQVTIIDDIYSRIEFGAWSSVTVTSVEYDSQGRVNKFAITINQ